VKDMGLGFCMQNSQHAVFPAVFVEEGVENVVFIYNGILFSHKEK
jgi:hypothetical protein